MPPKTQSSSSAPVAAVHGAFHFSGRNIIAGLAPVATQFYNNTDGAAFFSGVWNARIGNTYANATVCAIACSFSQVFAAYLNGDISRESFVVALWVFFACYSIHPAMRLIMMSHSFYRLLQLKSVTVTKEQHEKNVQEFRRAIAFDNVGPLCIMILLLLSFAFTIVVLEGYDTSGTITTYPVAFVPFTVAIGMLAIHLILKEHTISNHPIPPEDHTA